MIKELRDFEWFYKFAFPPPLPPSSSLTPTPAQAPQVAHPPVMQETQVWSLGQENALEKRMATSPSGLAWRIPRTEEPGRL